jgi:hypothetical protein
MEGLFFELPVGLHLNGEIHKDVELLRTNGVAEKIFLKKLSEKPYTWQGNVVSAAVKNIGTYEIGSEVREKYLKDGSVTIPMVVNKLTLADINTLLVEIHRRVWVSFIPKQEVICKYCGRKLIADIDLDKIDFLPETKETMESVTDYSHIVVDMKYGFKPPKISKLTDKEEYQGLTEMEFKRFVFRPPLLEDAIRNEKYISDSIGFWRRIAMDCLLEIQCLDDYGNVQDILPKEFHTYYGLKIFNEHLDGSDLRKVREALTEYLPTLPFAYYEPCGCDEQREIPMVMEASNFFSE